MLGVFGPADVWKCVLVLFISTENDVLFTFF